MFSLVGYLKKRIFMFGYKFRLFIILPFIICTEVRSCPEKDGCIYDESTLTVDCRSYVDGHYPGSKSLSLCKYENTTLYLSSIIKKVPKVEEINITSSNVSYLREPGKENNIKLLRINNSTLKRIPDNFFVNLRKLRVFDVRNNSLEGLPRRLKYFTRLEAVYLANNEWNCSLNMGWALDLNLSVIKDYKKLFCHDEQFEKYPVITAAIFLKNAEINCPSYCTCSLIHIADKGNQKDFKPAVEANCSDQGLTELPPILPNFTTTLRVERNSISDLSPLLNNRIYRKLTDIYLDDNLVERIGGLEGSYWLSHFRIFSLNNNKLTRLPTYAIDNALQQNRNMPSAVRINLGNNPWLCDCHFTPDFQEMLMKYERQIGDLNNIRCAFVQGDENSLMPILSLSRNSVCQLPSEYYIRPLDLVNIILASLIVLVLSKLAFDYYYFKKTGRLPWIVTKLP